MLWEGFWKANDSGSVSSLCQKGMYFCSSHSLALLYSPVCSTAEAVSVSVVESYTNSSSSVTTFVMKVAVAAIPMGEYKFCVKVRKMRICSDWTVPELSQRSSQQKKKMKVDFTWTSSSNVKCPAIATWIIQVPASQDLAQHGKVKLVLTNPLHSTQSGIERKSNHVFPLVEATDGSQQLQQLQARQQQRTLNSLCGGG